MIRETARRYGRPGAGRPFQNQTLSSMSLTTGSYDNQTCG